MGTITSMAAAERPAARLKPISRPSEVRPPTRTALPACVEPQAATVPSQERPSGRALPISLHRARRVSLSYAQAVAAALLCAAIGGSVVWGARPVATPAQVVTDQSIVLAGQTEAVPDDSVTALADRLVTLQGQVQQLSVDLDRARREKDALRNASQERSGDLTAAQTELAASEVRDKGELEDIEARLAALDGQVTSIEQLANEVRSLLGLPQAAAPAAPMGGPAGADATVVDDPWLAVRGQVITLEDRLSAAAQGLDGVDEQTLSRLTTLRATGLPMTGNAAADLAFWPNTPLGEPVHGPYTSYFGTRESPFVAADGTPGTTTEMHTGLDIAVTEGTPVPVTADGVVRVAGPYGGYGNIVIVDHGRGISTWYGHNSRVAVSPGQRVHRGDIIAYSGNTGRSTGPHVHYEIRINENPIDPLPLVRLGGS